ncbi:hypothetical protein [Maribacter halichondriae]|uniref:hypothetical protein n=1 Tax=Maribacter halichondriae TaxID=2980554 RepID=UPI002359B128|nr:hypothetical protein [Maribacter sp. Hal144]
MKKDIEIPIAKDVHIAIVQEWSDDFLSKDWNAYVLNNRPDLIEMVIVVSKGFDEDKKTSTMRHGIGVVGAKSFEKIELLQEEVLTLNNEFFLTFFADGKLYEKRFVFEKNTVMEQNLVHLPLIEKEGVMAS